MYSHDTFGLGHITRTLRIGRSVIEALPDATVLVLTGSPIAHRLTFPVRIEYVKLPSVRKRGPEQYVARDLGIPFWRLREMRVRIVRDTMRMFRPHLLFVDNVPTGMKGEILPALEELKRAGTALHLNLRDILDEPDVVRSQWSHDGTDQVLDSIYDEVHVFGVPSIHDSVRAYGLPPGKTLFHGYIAPPRGIQGERALSARRRDGVPSVLVTIGGGEDGAETIRCVLEAERSLQGRRRIQVDLVLGPLMACHDARSILEDVSRGGRVLARDFIADLADFMPEYDLVVSMGGYNTLCEVMAQAQRSLVIPRVYPRREQELRARAFESRGIVRVLHPSECTPEQLRESLRACLESGPTLPSPGTPSLEGLASLGRRLLEMAPTFRDRPSRTPRACGRGKAGTRTPLRIVGNVLTLALLWLCVRPGIASADLRPREVVAEALAGYDTNILDASDAEIRAFETGDPGTYFVVHRMEDAAAIWSVSGKWVLPSFRYKSDVRLRYERLQYLHEPIRAENHYSILVRTRMGSDTRADLAVAFAPDVYLRHRKDKDALPGEPVFRAEVRDEWDLSLTIDRALADAWSSQLTLEGSTRDYSRSFEERDRWRAGGRTGLTWQSSGGLKLGLSGGFRRLRSRNVPYLGSDLSYREWSIRSSVEGTCFGGFLKMKGYANRAWLLYTSRDPTDVSHFGRKDAEWELGLQVLHSLSPSLDWKATVDSMRRTAASFQDPTSDLDEEGSVRDTFVATGFAWHWLR